ncbi:hypothetical protein [Treponema sp. R80B11-R83G3]
MTMQASDTFSLGSKKYTLIDIEENKQIITCADFNLPKNKEIIVINSGCWRGYTAKYYVVKDKLYGIKISEVYNSDPKEKNYKSKKIFIPYTGSCIIAYGSGWNSDFLSTYLNYDEAYELYFENGILKEKLTLLSTIEKFKALNGSDKKWEEMEKIAREPLKYKYDIRSYKWRYKDDYFYDDDG